MTQAKKMPREGGQKVKGPAEGLAKEGPTEGSQHAKGPAEGLNKDEKDVEAHRVKR